MFRNYNTLGFNNKYVVHNKRNNCFNSFQSAISNIEIGIIDETAIFQIISKGYCFADRTLITGLSRTPWMAAPSESINQSWEFSNLPAHNKQVIPEREIAETLYGLLSNELLRECQSKQKIGILLSGGMDSRISAGILRNLEKQGKINGEIYAITWGIENSRDIIYAKEIAKRYNWCWKHINLTSENLLHNIDVCSEIGCETSPIHLHGITKVRDLEGLDLIIASSFGDSMGRGVFSSRHISKLVDIEQYLHNWFFLLKAKAVKQLKSESIKDLRQYRAQYKRNEPYQAREIEQLSNYMRRMLNPCIGIINSKIPVLQTFSSPDIYSYMWSLSPKLRNDNIYSLIIDKYFPEISDIPWSKTGLKYNTQEGIPDKFLKNYHSYHQWINNDLFDELYSELKSSIINEFQMLNLPALYNSIEANRKLKTNKATKIDEIFTWLIALSKMINKYNILISDQPHQSGLGDKVRSSLSKYYVNIIEQGISINKLIR